MIADHDGARRRFEESRDLGRSLARKLASAAVCIAETLDRLAVFHESIDTRPRSDRADEAARQARGERRIAEQERNAALWFLRIAEGETVKRSGQRLSSREMGRSAAPVREGEQARGSRPKT